MWRDVVLVEVSKPAAPFCPPVESKISVLLGEFGTAKLGRFKILNNSARNCTLKFSEIRVTELFLNTEKSRFASPGPVRILRPALPRRLKYCGYRTATGLPFESLYGVLLQLSVQKPILGADGP